MKLTTVQVAVVCLSFVQTCVSDLSAVQYLFTPTGGKQFDDGTYAIVPPVARVSSLLVNLGDYIDGLQATYILQDGQKIRGAWHGGRSGNSTYVRFGKKINEIVVRVEG